MAGEPDVQVRRLGPTDLAAYRGVRLSALRTEPQAFGSTFAEEAARPDAAHAERLASSAVFGAFAGAETVGLLGLRQLDGPQERHKAFLWGMYVEPAWRGRDVGSALLAAALRTARGWVEQVTLTVVDGNPAVSFYERFGFRRYGTEPRALKREGGYVDEALMVLLLDGGRPGATPGATPA